VPVALGSESRQRCRYRCRVELLSCGPMKTARPSTRSAHPPPSCAADPQHPRCRADWLSARAACSTQGASEDRHAYRSLTHGCHTPRRMPRRGRSATVSREPLPGGAGSPVRSVGASASEDRRTCEPQCRDAAVGLSDAVTIEVVSRLAGPTPDLAPQGFGRTGPGPRKSQRRRGKHQEFRRVLPEQLSHFKGVNLAKTKGCPEASRPGRS